MLKDYKPDMIFHLKVHTISHKMYTATPKRVKKGSKQGNAAMKAGLSLQDF